MDNEIFRKTYREVNERFCPYEKSILTNQCRCSRAKRFCIAEREGVNCLSDPAQQQCLDLLDLLRQQSRFALKATDARTALPHGKACVGRRCDIGFRRYGFVADKPSGATYYPGRLTRVPARLEVRSRRLLFLSKCHDLRQLPIDPTPILFARLPSPRSCAGDPAAT